MWGLDQISASKSSAARTRLRGTACAVLTHDAAIDRRGATTLQVLETLGVHPKVVFSPEHGLNGVAQAEEPVPSIEPSAKASSDDDSDGDTASDGSPGVISLYGATKESLTPRPEQLDGIETLVIDLVDVGSRYYTYVWTALLCARAAAERGIHTVVLDRPNPLGGNPADLEGKPQHPEFTSFVGLEPIAIRHGLTLGELLVHFFARDGRPLGPDGVLSVVACSAWERHRTAEAWGRPFVPPSPNMPSLETALLYPGGCLVEGTNLSEGRGTAFPFRVVGAPFLNAEELAQQLAAASLPGVLVRPVAFRPSFEKHAGSVCHGVMLHVTEPSRFRPVATYLTLLCLARRQAPHAFRFLDRVYEFESKAPAFDLLTGSNAVREAMLTDTNPNDVVELVSPVSEEETALIARAEALLVTARA